MPNTREKLIEILETVVSPKELLCDGEVLVSTARVADHLIANDVTIQKWIPVTERLPKRGQEVIVASYRTIKPVVFTMYFWDKEHDNWVGITHWMPLPEPPKGE